MTDFAKAARGFGGWLGAALAHDDPRVAAGNLVAAVLAWNTPFYPLYLLWVVGTDAFPSAWLTLCSLPLWIAVPWLSHRNALAARILLPLAGMANIVFCTWILGEAGGTELFLAPTTILAGLLFRRSERWLLAGLGCLPLVLYFGLSGHYGAPLHEYSAAQNLAMLRLNAGSVATFSIFLAYVASGLIGEA